MTKLCHGELNVKNRTKNINKELDAYKKEQAKINNAKKQSDIDLKKQAKIVFEQNKDAILKKHGERFGKEKLLKKLKDMARLEPNKFLVFVDKFKKEQSC